MQLGFVIDHARCIGCHACTVACKSENDVPLDAFRTWVKYTETGDFPQVRRSFAVLRCNQCTDAPCVTICPVTALEKRPDGIVDVDPDVCIGCKACMQGCPYDALYIHPDKGTVEKCHFCAHRTERGLAPACAVVCPTEAIVPGDLDDPHSRVSRLRDEGGLAVRKPEAGTGPNVLYREADPAGLDPALTNAAGGSLWAQRRELPQWEADVFAAAEERARTDAGARTSYDVDHPPPWGASIGHYLFTKSLAAGIFLAALPLMLPLSAFGGPGVATRAEILVSLLALGFLLATASLLVSDLQRPERFLSIMLRPNWDSWLAKGSYVIAAYGVLLAGLLTLQLAQVRIGGASIVVLLLTTGVFAALSACYTAWLFAQAKGRALWMRRGLALQLLVHAWVAGGATLLVLHALAVSVAAPEPATIEVFLRAQLVAALGAHLLLILCEGTLAPRGREDEYRRAQRLLTSGPLARRHWLYGVVLGILVPLVLLALPVGEIGWALGAVCALVGLHAAEDALVRAGQALPIS